MKRGKEEKEGGRERQEVGLRLGEDEERGEHESAKITKRRYQIS